MEERVLKNGRLPLNLGPTSLVDREGVFRDVATWTPPPAASLFRLRLAGLGAQVWPEILLLLGLCTFVFFHRLGEPSLWDNSEPEYAATALEMLNTGNWLTPHFNGTPVYVHPPLYYWLTALSFHFLGVSEFSARLFSTLFALGTVLLVFHLGRSLYNVKVGVYAAFIMATFLGHIVIARLAFLDTALNFFVLLAVVSFLRACSRATLLTWALFWLALGLAVLSKGPVGLVIPFLVLIPFLVSIRRLNMLRDRTFWLAGLAFFAPVAPWYALEVWAHGVTFLQTYFTQFTLGRFWGVVMNQGGPWYYYLVSLVPLAFPWCAWIPAAAYHLYHRRQETSTRFVLLWIIIPLLFFSCARTKMPWYIINIYPFLAIAVARFFHDWEVEGQNDPRLRWHGRLGLVLLITLSLLAFTLLPAFVIDSGYPEAVKLAPLTGIALVGALLAAWGARWSCRSVVTVSAAMMMALTIAMTTYILPETEKYKRRGISLQIASLAAPRDRVGIFDAFGFTVPFYGQHQVDLIRQDVEGIRSFLGARPYRSFYVMPLHVYREVRKEFNQPLTLLALENDFALVVNRGYY